MYVDDYVGEWVVIQLLLVKKEKEELVQLHPCSFRLSKSNASRRPHLTFSTAY
jgi:hypothetical protein